MNLIIQIQEIRDSFMQSRDELKARHINWDDSQDARITFFSKCISVLNSTQLGKFHIRQNLLEKKWWLSISAEPILDSDIQILIKEFDMFIKMGFLQFIFSSIESSMRLFVKSIDPTACQNGTAEFKNIYSYLLKKINKQEFLPLLDLLRCIRNTIHTNGVYFHRSQIDVSVLYLGKTYEFKIGKPIDFVNWQFLLQLTKDVQKMILEIVDSKNISTFDEIIDPFFKETLTELKT